MREKYIIRKILVMMVAVMSVMALSSCDDDDTYYGNPLTGRWQLIAPTNVNYNEWVLNPNGTGTYFVSDYWGDDYYPIRWNSYGNQLQVYFQNGEVWNYGWTVQGYTLYLYPDNSGIPLVYQSY